MKRVHFIAIGGSVMHNLALCLHGMGYEVTGSDDIIYDPAKSRLDKAGILPNEVGWHPDNIHQQLDFVILGMHAKKENPELEKAQELSLPIYSFPEFIARKSADKLRIVVAGSHGKTTTTSMIMHGLRRSQMNFDFLVGAQLKGFDVMVHLSDAPIIVIEGDEYLSSALDSQPKFLHYQPHICVLTGLDWDHYNVFPTYQKYLQAFRDLVEGMSEKAILIFNQYDPAVKKFIHSLKLKCQVVGYQQAQWQWDKNHWKIQFQDEEEVKIVLPGEHNVVNLMSALQVLQHIPDSHHPPIRLFDDFQLPDKRLNQIHNSPSLEIYRDFAHAPSKVKASVNSMRIHADQRQLIAVLEIHTYSSLNRGFLPQYSGALDQADQAFLYYNPINLEIKNLEAIDEDFLKSSFDRNDLHVFTDFNELKSAVKAKLSGNDLILLMSSSNFGGLDWLSLVN